MCRMVWSRMPLRASTSRIARSAIGGAGRHVAGILLVAGRIGDDEGAARRRDIAIGDVDGDALLLLGLEAVDQQGEIEVVADRAVFSEVAFERRHLIVVRPASGHRACGRSASTCRHRPSRRSETAASAARSARLAAACAPRAGYRAHPSSEISLALLLFHRAGFIGVDQASLALGHGATAASPRSSSSSVSRLGFDGAGQRIAAERPEPRPGAFRELSPGRSGRRSSSTMISVPSRFNTGRCLAK